MPQICSFYGRTSTHSTGGKEVTVAIRDLRAMDGAIPARAMGLVVEWAAKSSGALMEDWALAEQHLPLKKIAPLT